jgi:hypothetical protein
MENINIISIFHPIMVRNAVSPGAVQNAECPDKTITHPFHVSFKKSDPNNASPEKTAFQLPVIFAV